jgi:hypothetical protein
MNICCFIKDTLRWHKKCTFSGWVSLAKKPIISIGQKKISASQRAALLLLKALFKKYFLNFMYIHFKIQKVLLKSASRESAF